MDVNMVLRSAVVVLAVLLAACASKPTNTYDCSPRCFMDCQAHHLADSASWTREQAIEMAEYCHSIRNECITCIKRIEADGNACGVETACKGTDLY